MAVIRHEIPLYSDSADRGVKVNPSGYSGTCTWYLEVYGKWDGYSGDETLYLKKGSGTTVHTQTWTSSENTNRIKRTQISGTITADTYYFDPGWNISVKHARLVCLQDTGSSPLTASESRFALELPYTYTSSTTYEARTPIYWKYVASEWDGSLTAYLCASLYSSGASITNTTAIQKSSNLMDWDDVVTISSAGAAQFVESDGFSLSDGYYYRVVCKASQSGGTVYTYAAQLRIVQTGSPITKLQEAYDFTHSNFSGTGAVDGRAQFVTSHWSGVSNVYRFAMSCFMSSDTAYLYNATDSESVEDSTISGIAHPISSAIAIADDGDQFYPYVSSGFFNLRGFRILVNVSISSSGASVEVSGAAAATSGASAVAAFGVNVGGAVSVAAGAEARGEVSFSASGVVSATLGATTKGEKVITASGLSPPASSVTGRATMEAEILVSGALAGALFVSARAQIEKNTSGSCAASASVSGTPGIECEAAGPVAALSSTASRAELGVGISGAASAVSVVEGEAEKNLILSGAVGAESGVSGRLEVERECGGATGGESSITSSLALVFEVGSEAATTSTVSGGTVSELLAAGASGGTSSLSGGASVLVALRLIARLDHEGNLAIVGSLVTGQSQVSFCENGDLEVGSVALDTSGGMRIDGATLHVHSVEEEATIT